jgi:SNF2 family DNA or RNA helicase
MIVILNSAARTICKWLEARLPALDERWWQNNVFDRLTFQQQRSVQERNLRNLTDLDLAALLRVLDQNWHDLSAGSELPRDARNWLKEMQGVRNRWAHAPNAGLDPNDTYRDADTVERLCRALGASDESLAAVIAFKRNALSAVAGGSGNSSHTASASQEPAPPQEKELTTKTAPGQARFKVGELVCLRSNSASIFPILEVLPGGSQEPRYRVFENGSRPTYYESQLQAIATDGESTPTLNATELSALLTATQLASPSATAVYSFNSGRVRFVPYQYRPVFKLIKADRPRLLIADEVGVGKTIEAGLILKELQARHDIRSVLIICPKALVAERKWQVEMKRFDEDFTHLDGALLRHCLKETHLSGEWPAQYEKAIVPFSLFDADLLFGKSGRGKSRDQGLLELDPPPKFDLVIVDEAHHIRNADTFLHQGVRYFADNAEAVVFLSATPVQLGREDLFTLLNVLRPDLVIDQASFSQMAEPNPYINEAINVVRASEPNWDEQVQKCLRDVASTDWGRRVLTSNPGFQAVYDSLSQEADDALKRIRTIQALEDLYTFSNFINRTRRRDIGEFTTRKPETKTVDFTPAQRSLHDDLLATIANILARKHGNQNVKFLMSTVSRQAASSLFGLAPALEDMLNGKLEELELEEDDAGAPDAGAAFLESLRGDVTALIERARILPQEDPKADAFMSVIRDKLLMPSNKVLAFSTFRHTLRYLSKRLDAAGVRYGLVHGGVSDEDRAILRQRFSLDKSDPEALDVLLSSEVGCEGLDFQFCDCLINYDLPWNPMRIEQRIGRIDRYGQLSPTVAVFNFVTPGTVDAEIYTRCLSRIGVFNHAIGASEEILGEISRELRSIAESFDLTEDERAARLQQLADNKVRRIEEERRLEEKEGELFGLNLAAASWEEKLNENRAHWLEPAALGVAISTYLRRRLGTDQEYLSGDKAVKTLRLSQEARSALLEDFRRLPRSNDPTARSWERWLKGSSPTLRVTFEQDAAVENRDAVLLSLGHPLVRQAAQTLQEPATVAVRLAVENSVLPEGEHVFALYKWSKQGVRRDEELIAVAHDNEVAQNLPDLLPGGRDDAAVPTPTQADIDALDTVHHRLWLDAVAAHAESNTQLVAARVQSLTASHQARKRLLEEQISRATNPKIRLMKQSELERAAGNYSRQLTQLEAASSTSDIKATQVVVGTLHIRRPQ